ncbi:MAG: hypothetical protein AVDCRST_MAG01-01-2315 [uncultured Rubrobacteraceae bacterium]|uniref:Uncharacterized protein n=1 Tax=uncultured Rubrobacteraceae bacterium TaxID=349277 RepID=A0A6J4PT58_9ACTN|nr:MAG: hypothetical protein AVDCRST_MAG01-01-2315 [uncultured Rubrobacteraceae bacterium]
MKNSRGRGVRWGAVALGWIVASAAGVLLSPAFRFLYGAVAGPPAERGEFTATIVAISLVSGFVAYLLGGYVAGRLAGVSGGVNGAMTAVIGLAVGLVLTVVLAAFGVLFSEGVTVPPAGFGFAGAALPAGLLLFLANLMGGYVGGKLGEPPDA